MEEVSAVHGHLEEIKKVLTELSKLEGRSKGAWANLASGIKDELEIIKVYEASFEDYKDEESFDEMEDFDATLNHLIKHVADAEKKGKILGLAEAYQKKHFSKGDSKKDGSDKIKFIEDLEDEFAALEVDLDDLDDLRNDQHDAEKRNYKLSQKAYKDINTSIKKFLGQMKRLKAYQDFLRPEWKDINVMLREYLKRFKTYSSAIKAADTLPEMADIFYDTGYASAVEAGQLVFAIDAVDGKIKKVTRRGSRSDWSKLKAIYKSAAENATAAFKGMENEGKRIRKELEDR